MKTSLLISTYNWPAALDLCLKSVLGQSVMPADVIICDDGSGEATKTLVDEWKKKFPVPLIHIWQPDEGFQLAKIRNRGFAASASDYLVQADGDLIFHKDFIKDHNRLARPGYFTTGSRVLLSAQTTESLLQNKCIEIKKYASGDRNFFNSLRMPLLQPLLAPRYKSAGRHKYYVKGCNMAFWKKDIIEVNGYNEDFTGWGREDSEMAIRLINAGIQKQFLKFGGISYHLYHREASREMEETNIKKMQDAIEKKLVRSPLGISQYL